MKLLAAACLAFALFAGSHAQAQSGRGVGLEIAASRRPAGPVAVVSAPGPAIPEPTGALLFGAGLLAAVGFSRRAR